MELAAYACGTCGAVEGAESIPDADWRGCGAVFAGGAPLLLLWLCAEYGSGRVRWRWEIEARGEWDPRALADLRHRLGASL